MAKDEVAKLPPALPLAVPFVDISWVRTRVATSTLNADSSLAFKVEIVPTPVTLTVALFSLSEEPLEEA